MAVGAATALMALFLLWTDTWDPVTPAYPEPPGARYLQLVIGVVAILIGARLLREERLSRAAS